MLVSPVKSGAPEVQVNQLLASSASWLCQGERGFGWVHDFGMKDCKVMPSQGEVSESGTL